MSSRGCSGTCGSTRCRPWGWALRRCSACSSASAGRRASGPTLAVITTLSITEGTAGRGALLSVFYALGLGLPFIVAAIAFRKALGAFAVIRRHQQWSCGSAG